jgi:hypothetical protein
MNTGVLSATLGASVIWRLPISADSCVRLRPVADFDIAMSLDMSLVVAALPVSLGDLPSHIIDPVQDDSELRQRAGQPHLIGVKQQHAETVR